MCGAKSLQLLPVNICWLWAIIMLPTYAQAAVLPPAAATATATKTLLTQANNIGNISANVTQPNNYIEYLPSNNDIAEALFVRNQLPSGSNKLLPFKFILRNGEPGATTNGKWHIKIYGEGVEHKLPPFFERILQRVQTYFSVYKHVDTSRPLQQPVVVVAGTESLINVAQSSTTGGVASTTTAGMTATTRPSVTATSTTATSSHLASSSISVVNSNVLSSTIAATTPPIFVGVTGSSTSTHDSGDDDEYAEFIAIGENDEHDFITVGEE